MSKYSGNIVTTGADTGYSVAFDGTGDYLTVANNTALLASTGDFTWETWVYRANNGCDLFFKGTVGTGAMEIYLNGSNQLRISTYSGSTEVVIATSTATITASTWTHVAVSRSGTSLRLFVGGTLDTTVTNSTDFNNTGTLYIGASPSGSAAFSGYMSNLRFIKGTALYTANFAPPTQLLNVTNTSLLTCNSPAIIDQSSNAFTITVNGDAKVSTFTPFAGYQAYNPALGAATPGIWSLSDALNAAATRQWNMYDPYFNYTTLKLSGTPVTNVPTWITDASTNNFAVTPFGDARAANLSPFSLTTYPNSGSGYFDGTGDYLTTASNAAFGFGTGDFTAEAWIYVISVAADRCIFDWRIDNTTYANTNGTLYVDSTTGKLAYWNGTKYGNNGTTIPLSTWCHVAISRQSGTTRVFLNGSLDFSTTATFTFASSCPNSIGGTPTSGASPFFGYISNARVVKGTALYTSNFTVPTAPLTAVSGTSLLTLQTSQSANNNTFLDSSSNNFLITRNGNTTQGTFSPFSQSGWSNYFSRANSQFLTLSNAGDFSFGTGAFTIECWVNPASLPSGSGYPNSYWLFGGGPLNSNPGIDFYINSTQIGFNLTDFTTPTAIGNHGISIGNWYHVAVVRGGGSNQTVSIYVNGTRVATASSVTATANAASTGIAISAAEPSGATSGNFDGYISNYRVVKGTAVYDPTSSTLTVPTASLTAVSNTVLLTCQSNRFVDANTQVAAKTITVNGTPSVQAFSPFNTNVAYTPALQGGSGYFDGTGDYLSAPSGASITGTGAFTAEFWVYLTTTSNSYIFAGGVNTWGCSIDAGGGLSYGKQGVANVISASILGNILNQWTHIVIARNGSSSAAVWRNGVRVATATDSNTYSAGAFNIGAAGNATGLITGYMGPARITNTDVYGVANTTITVPTNPFTSNANTSLLLNFTNAGITDSTAKNVLETVGNAQISTTQSKFGGSSMYFDGTGSYMKAPNSAIVNLSGDFTVEAWLYRSVAGVNTIIMCLGSYAAAANGFTFYVTTTNFLAMYGNNAVITIGPTTFPLNTWTHVALVRSGTGTNNLKMYINGVQESGPTAPVTNTTSFVGVAANGLSVGGWYDGSAFGASGTCYISDLRISRYARYTGNFTPPTSLLQNQ